MIAVSIDYPFVEGLVLADQLYHEGVKPVMARLRTQLEWLERTHPKAAAGLREGVEETFATLRSTETSLRSTSTINRLGLSPMLRKCLTTTNIVESSLSGVEGPTGGVTRWRSGEMALRWAAAAALETQPASSYHHPSSESGQSQQIAILLW